jgi:hypothetical protein
MKFSSVLIAAFATNSAVAAPQRLRTLQISMSIGEDAAPQTTAAPVETTAAAVEEAAPNTVEEVSDVTEVKVETEMSVHSKATKLFKPAPSKAAKEASMPEDDAAFAKSGKSHSISMPSSKAEKE